MVDSLKLLDHSSDEVWCMCTELKYFSVLLSVSASLYNHFAAFLP